MSVPKNEQSNFQTENHPHVETKSEVIAEEFNEPPVAGKAIDRIDEHTPSNPVPPDRDEPDPSDGRDKLRPLYEMMERLGDTVNVLANAVAGMQKDTKVRNNVPWTHRGGRHE
jgi:hypothetical protein